MHANNIQTRKELPNLPLVAGATTWTIHVTHGLRQVKASQNIQFRQQLCTVPTGEEEDLDLGKMAREGEVAWLHKADMPGSGRAEHAGEMHQQGWHAQKQNAHSPDQAAAAAAARKRKEPPASRHTYPASRPASAHPSGSACLCPTLSPALPYLC